MTDALPYVTAAETIAAIEKRYNPAEIGAMLASLTSSGAFGAQPGQGSRGTEE